jgi:NADH-quinone oxidoreductase subunit E
MADRRLAPDTPELRARWGGFAWSKDNANQAKILGAIDVVFEECDR